MISSKVRWICSSPTTDQYASKSFQNAIEKGQWYNKWVKVSDGNIANQIHGFTIDYGKFILISDIPQFPPGNIRSHDASRPIEQAKIFDGL